MASSAITALKKYLNEIYLTVLKYLISLKFSNKEKEEIYNMLKHRLRSIVVLLLSLSTSSLSRLLHLLREDISWTFKDLHVILNILEDLTHLLCLHHPSFCDFLLSKDQCRDF